MNTVAGAHFPISEIAAVLEDAKKDSLEEAKTLMARTGKTHPQSCWTTMPELTSAGNHRSASFSELLTRGPGALQDTAKSATKSTPHGSSG